jgi:predicted RNA-binding Zn-ribbon protein involved in translation (DUF1610 family)
MGDHAAAPTTLDRKLVRTSPVLWLLGAVLAALLAALGTRLLEDIADLFPTPDAETYRAPRLAALQEERLALEDAGQARTLAALRGQRDLSTLEQTLSTAEESWRTWLSTRATLGGTGSEDREVRQRRDRLDAMRAERDAAAARLDALRRAPDPLAARRAALEARLRAAGEEADREYAAALGGWRLKVLAARLALVVPLLLLAGWLWARRRRSRYLTLLWGYWAFALWMLGLGVWPYLPRYGGYAPLGLGVALTVWASMSLVRAFNRRAPARRRRIVDRALARHRCPGCDRDYLLGRELAVDLGLARKGSVRHFDREALRPRACPACGIALFAACPACRVEQVAHLDHCAACGVAWPASDAAAGPEDAVAAG